MLLYDIPSVRVVTSVVGMGANLLPRGVGKRL